MKSNISSDMNKPCWKLVKACPQSQKLFCFGENNLLALFGCFVIALNASFTQQLSLADDGYESGSDTIDLPTPLWKTPHIHHVSSIEHVSFNPVNTTPCSIVTITSRSTPQTPTRPVHQCLSFSSDTDHTPHSTPACSDSSDEEE